MSTDLRPRPRLFAPSNNSTPSRSCPDHCSEASFSIDRKRLLALGTRVGYVPYEGNDVTRKTVRIAMNGVTGRMGYRQHLVRSILAIREQGGLDLGDGTVLWPEPILVGRREHALQALAEQHGLDPANVSTDLDAVLADPTVDIYFDAQVTSAREEAIKKAIAAGKHIYTEKPTATGLDGALELARLAQRRRHQARRRPGQALPARACSSSSASSTAASSAGSSPSAASSATGSSRATGRPPSAPPGTTARRTAAASSSTCSRTGSTCCTSCSAGSKSVQAHRRHPHPAALGRARQALRRHRRRRRLRHLRARRRRHRPDQLLLGGPRQPRRTRRVPGRRHRGLRRRRACATAASSTAPPPPSRSGTRTSRPPSSFRDQWQEVPDNAEFDNGFKAQWELFLKHVVRRRALPLGPARRRPRRPARRTGPEVLGRGPPPRRTGDRACDHPTPRRRRAAAGLRAPRRAPRRSPPAPRFTSRTVFSAAHVVADPFADSPPTRPAAVDWDATLAFRRHLWSHGLGVAEAMDTAQRGMGLDWAGAAELIRRSRRRGQGGRRPDRLRRRHRPAHRPAPPWPRSAPPTRSSSPSSRRPARRPS